MNTVAIYCRLSDEDRNKLNKAEDSESIQNQKALLNKYAMDHGWEVYKIYSDDDYSGLDSERPEFNQLISDAKAGKFNIVLCKSQSRFTRDMELVEKYIHNKFIEWGIRFIGLTDNADTFERGNKKSRQINGLVNEWYCEDISENIKAVFEVKRKNGEFIGSFAPYGYRKDPLNKNKLLIDQDAAEVIKRIYRWYLEGFGVQQIAFMLNEKGVPNPTKYKEISGLRYKNSFKRDDYGLWNKTTIKRILRNEIYLGHMIQAKRKKISYKSKKISALPPDKWIKVENTHEPIIDLNTFLSVQHRMAGRVKTSGQGKPHLFATKVKCMDCGNTMLKVTSGKYRYLRCKSYAVPGKSMCTSHLTRLDQLTACISDKIKEYLNDYIDVDSVASRLESEQGIENSHRAYYKELNKVRREIIEKDHIIRNLYVDKTKGLISDEQFIELNSGFTDERKRLIERQNSLQKELELNGLKQGLKQDYKVVVKNYLNFSELTHTMVNGMIDYIEIGEKFATGQKIRIHWLF
jgi:site-specific DNA recombinase